MGARKSMPGPRRQDGTGSCSCACTAPRDRSWAREAREDVAFSSGSPEAPPTPDRMRRTIRAAMVGEIATHRRGGCAPVSKH